MSPLQHYNMRNLEIQNNVGDGMGIFNKRSVKIMHSFRPLVNWGLTFIGKMKTVIISSVPQGTQVILTLVISFFQFCILTQHQPAFCKQLLCIWGQCSRSCRKGGRKKPDRTSSKTWKNVRRLMHKRDQTYSHYAAKKFKKGQEKKK